MAGGAEPRNGRRPPRVAIVLITLAVAVVAALVACTDDPPKPPPSTTAPVTTPPSPTAKAPTAPEAKPTPESAEAFVRYFWEVFNYANLALDPNPLQAISEKSCLFCRSAVDVIDDLLRSGKQVRGGLVQVETAAAPPGKITGNAVITAVISQTPGETFNPQGVTSKTAGVRNMRSEIALHWAGGEWRVRDVANDEKTGTKW